VRALLRGAPGPALAAARAVLPHAAGRLLRGDRQRARPGVALCRQPVTARVPASWRARGGAGPLVLSRTRARLPLEVHDAVFTWVLQRLAERGLIKGERIGVDASSVEANAALRAIVRRDSGEGYREMLVRMAKESGVETPTAEDLIRLDRKRKGKTLSNAEWASPTDPDARIAKLKPLT